MLELPLIWIYNYSMLNKRMKEVEIKIILECFVEECKIKGRVLSVEEFMEDIENSIGWDEVFCA